MPEIHDLLIDSYTTSGDTISADCRALRKWLFQMPSGKDISLQSPKGRKRQTRRTVRRVRWYVRASRDGAKGKPGYPGFSLISSFLSSPVLADRSRRLDGVALPDRPRQSHRAYIRHSRAI